MHVLPFLDGTTREVQRAFYAETLGDFPQQCNACTRGRQVGPGRTVASCASAWTTSSLVLFLARAWSGSLSIGRITVTIGRGENRRATLADFRQVIRPGRKCDRRSECATIVAAIPLTAAPAPQNNASCLTGEVLAGGAAASLDPKKRTRLRQ
jgi:hypothetical protein